MTTKELINYFEERISVIDSFIEAHEFVSKDEYGLVQMYKDSKKVMKSTILALKMSLTQKELIIEFLQDDDTWDKSAVIQSIIESIDDLKNVWPDEVYLNYDETSIMSLEDFSIQFFDRVLTQVCNVIESE